MFWILQVKLQDCLKQVKVQDCLKHKTFFLVPSCSMAAGSCMLREHLGKITEAMEAFRQLGEDLQTAQSSVMRRMEVAMGQNRSKANLLVKSFERLFVFFFVLKKLFLLFLGVKNTRVLTLFSRSFEGSRRPSSMRVVCGVLSWKKLKTWPKRRVTWILSA